MSEQWLIDASDVRQELWECAEEIFASEPDNYKFNALLDIVDRQQTIWPPVVQWISVEDRLPTVEPKDLSECATDNGKYFLVCFEGGYVDICAFWARGNKFGDEGVTHWMPLPEPPEGGNGMSEQRLICSDDLIRLL